MIENSIETVLNLIQKQQQEIEEADEIIDNSIESQNEREKYMHILEEKIVKLEKVIDEMASRIEILDDDFGAFKEGIKQYYYRKVEEDEKEKI